MSRRWLSCDVVTAVVAAASLWSLGVRGPAVAVAVGGLAVWAASHLAGDDHAAARRAPALAVLIAVVAAVVAVGASPDTFALAKLAGVALTVVTLQGLNLVVGYSGQLLLAHVAFMGIGAYTVAITSGTHGWPLVAGIAMAFVVAGLGGFLLSIPAARLAGHYLAIASLSLAIVFGPVMKLDALGGLTGGVQGLSFFDKPFSPPAGFRWLDDAQWHASLALVLAALACGVVAVIAAAPLGRAIRAGRDSPAAAASLGVNVPRVRMLCLVLSAGFGGLAGALLFLTSNRFVSPDAFTLSLMIELLVALMVGGKATVAGPVLGALFLVFVYRDGVTRVSDDYADGNVLTLALVFAGLAFVVGLRVWEDRRTIERLGRAASALVATGVVTWILAIVLRDHFVATALGGLLMGVVLIVAVLAVPAGLAAVRLAPVDHVAAPVVSAPSTDAPVRTDAPTPRPSAPLVTTTQLELEKQ